MKFEFSEEQHDIQRTLREFIAARAPIAKTREWMATEQGFDRDFWRSMAGEVGLQGLILPERFGGTGYGAVELSIAMEELGREVVCAPFFSTLTLAAHTLLELGDDEAQQAWLPRIASGECVATLALTERAGRWDAEAVAMRAEPVGGDAVMTGAKDFVTDGASADCVFVVVRVGDAFGVLAVDGQAPGLRRETLARLDETRPLARLVFDGVRAPPIGPPVPWSRIQRVLDRACIALAAEQLGGAARALEMAVAYAKQREQFGRPVGSFQAIKHKCADMLMRVEAARSAAYYSAWTAGCTAYWTADARAPDRRGAPDDGAAALGVDDLRSVASLAKADVSEAFLQVAEENLQIHGGLGFTWEQDPHLYLKRARSSYVLLGDPAYHRALTAAELFDAPEARELG